MELKAMAYLAIFIGGGAGSVLRFAMSKAMVAQGWLQGHWATLVINVLASFALVLIVDAYDDKSKLFYLLLLGTGFCGGWSTFSTFSYETINLIGEGRLTEAVLYVVLSVILGAGAAIAASIWVMREYAA
ncbi:MAG: CrcB family protein [Flavobacteriia bacterium]|nr:CrcB family protein [Flavobacteriia bacterium]